MDMTPLEQLEAWLDGTYLEDHETFSGSKDFWKQVLAEIDPVQYRDEDAGPDVRPVTKTRKRARPWSETLIEDQFTRMALVEEKLKALRFAHSPVGPHDHVPHASDLYAYWHQRLSQEFARLFAFSTLNGRFDTEKIRLRAREFLGNAGFVYSDTHGVWMFQQQEKDLNDELDVAAAGSDVDEYVALRERVRDLEEELAAREVALEALVNPKVSAAKVVKR